MNTRSKLGRPKRAFGSNAVASALAMRMRPSSRRAAIERPAVASIAEDTSSPKNVAAG